MPSESALSGLSVVLNDGQWLVGARMNRSLWHIDRHDLHLCAHCGQTHVHHQHNAEYRMVEFGSEPLSNEAWREVGENVVFTAGPDLGLSLSSVPGRADWLD